MSDNGIEDSGAEGTIDDVALMLTAREREVATMLAQGFTNREIAEQVGISIKTVDTHRGHVLKKLRLKNNAILTHLAISRGWVSVLDFSELENAATNAAIKQAAK